MIIFIYQFRSQNVAIKDAAYQKALDDYTNSISMLVARPELGKLLDEIDTTRGAAGEMRARLNPDQGPSSATCS